MPASISSAPAAADPVPAIRHFNRFYTQKIGLLDRGLHRSNYSLTEVRVLFEVAHHPGTIALVLEGTLGLDRGYLSRILTRLTHDRLLQRVRSKADGRQLELFLTPKGKTLFHRLDQHSSAQIRELVGHLPSVDQRRLASHFFAVQRLLTPAPNPATPLVLRDPQPGDFGWVVQRHGALYAEEFGWNAEFEATVAEIVAQFIRKQVAKRDHCWIAELGGEPVGCVFLVHHSDNVAKLRLLLVEPSARGHGLGRRLVDTCIEFARQAGYQAIELWTNNVLSTARRIYQTCGFRLTKSEPHSRFGPAIVGETWALNLQDSPQS